MPKTIEEIYASLLADSEASWAAGVKEAAYHALVGALHCAEALVDESRVKHIRQQAHRLRTSLDRNQPRHRLATASAADRGHVSVFTTLVVQADAIAARMHATQAVDHARARMARSALRVENQRLP